MRAGDMDEIRFDWRRGGAAAGGLVAALILVAMVILVKFANDDRERALSAERHTYEVALVVRNVSANVSRAEAALARFVLDEDVKTSGNIYASDWRLAGFQIDRLSNLMRTNPEQLRRVAQLRQLYEKRGDELALAAQAALAKQGDAGISYFYQAATKGSGQDLDNKLEEIIRAEQQSLRQDYARSQIFSAEADRFTDYLSWLGILVGVGAIFLGVVAVAALRQNAQARRQAESEAERAEVLELAVRERTQELWEANRALKAEAADREAAEAQLRQVQKMEAVGQLTGGIAHDFNNMLTVVVGGIDLALRRLNGPRREVMMHLNNAMEGATRAAALTRRLLSFARSEPLLPERADSADVHVAGARILLVEDDPRVRTATVGALEDLDYDPVACSSGAEAIALFNAQEFDLVISDVIMPEMTGPELIRYLKRTSPRDFAVLFVTGYVGEGESDDLRGHELLRKPFTVGALASAVNAALARTASEPPQTSAGAARG